MCMTSKQMSKTIIAGRIAREELKKARESEVHPFLRLAGTIAGPKDLSKRRLLWKMKAIAYTVSW